MKKIGILGGTFNPFHKGHLYIANAAYTQLGLDLVYIMPCGIPPHKDMDSSVTRYQRMSMCQKVCSNYPYLRLLDTELKEDGPSYSYRTLERIREGHPDWELYFIIGEDSLDQFSTWKHPELIAQSASLAVAIRRAGKSAGIDKVCKAIREEYGARIFLLDSDYIDVSSTEIRHIIREKRDGVEQALASLIPAEVLSFIREHRLYSNGGIELSPKKDIKPSDFPRLKADIEKKLEKKLKPSRYMHTIGVAYTSASLAMAYGYPMDIAFIAGLLHDCAKYMSPSELYAFCEKKDIEISAAEKKSPQLLHAKAGAYLAEKDYGITDKDILHAVRVHTTGCPEMNLLDQILFTADYIEPNRDKARRLTEIRQAAFKDLRLAIEMILSDTIEYLKETGKEIDQTTYKTYEWLKACRPKASR